MNGSHPKPTRGEFMRTAVALPALAGFLTVATAAPARAAKGSQAQFKYQDKPDGAKKCSNCTFYLPARNAATNGSCKIVEGSISPNGYCIAYSPMSS